MDVDIVLDQVLSTEITKPAARKKHYHCDQHNEAKAEHQKFFKDLCQGNSQEKSMKMFSRKLGGTRKKLQDQNVQSVINSGMMRIMTMNVSERSIFNKRIDIAHQKIDFQELHEKIAHKHELLLERINLVRKQMILQEVCRDIIKVHEIMVGLIKYEHAHKLAKEELHHRQVYRKRFEDVIINQIRQRYGHQAYIFYQYDEDHQEIENIEQRSIEARTLLLEICKLMIENGIVLDWSEE